MRITVMVLPPPRYTHLWMPVWLNLPNFFTLARLVLTPFVIAAILDGRHMTALLLFAAAGVTDYLDGITARRFEMMSQVGAYLDPIADKCLLSGVFLALMAAKIVPKWVVVIIFARDLLILAGVVLVLLFTSVRKFPPSAWGKWSTGIQMCTAVVWMARNAVQVPILDGLAWLMLWPCVGLTFYSGLDYTVRGIRIARAH